MSSFRPAILAEEKSLFDYDFDDMATWHTLRLELHGVIILCRRLINFSIAALAF